MLFALLSVILLDIQETLLEREREREKKNTSGRVGRIASFDAMASRCFTASLFFADSYKAFESAAAYMRFIDYTHPHSLRPSRNAVSIPDVVFRGKQ